MLGAIEKVFATLRQSTSVLGEVELAVVVLTACVYTICSLPAAGDYLLNADALYIPALVADLREDLLNIFGWRFPPASYFFPDLVMFLPVSLLSSDTMLQVRSFSVLQLSLLYLVSRWLFMETGGGRGWVFTASFLCAALALTALGVLVSPVALLRFFAYALVSGFHFGAYLSALLCLTLALRYGRTGCPMVLTSVLAVIVATSVSDLLFVAFFVLPFLATSVLFALARTPGWSRLAVVSIMAVAVTVAAFLVNSVINPSTAQYVGELGLDRAAASLTRIVGSWMASPSVIPFGLAVVGCPLVTALWLAAAGGLDRYRFSVNNPDRVLSARHAVDERTRADCAAVFLAASALSAAMTILAFAFVIDLEMIEHYATPVVYSPGLSILISGSRMIARRFPGAPFAPRRVMPAMAGLCVFFAVAAAYSGVPSPLAVPPYLACFRGLTGSFGLAGYWQAKPLRLLSEQELKVAAIQPDGSPSEWIDNRFNMIDGMSNESGPSPVEFIFISGLNPELIFRRYGAPTERRACGGSEIWIYTQTGILRRALLRRSGYCSMRRLLSWEPICRKMPLSSVALGELK